MKLQNSAASQERDSRFRIGAVWNIVVQKASETTVVQLSLLGSAKIVTDELHPNAKIRSCCIYNGSPHQHVHNVSNLLIDNTGKALKCHRDGLLYASKLLGNLPIFTNCRNQDHSHDQTNLRVFFAAYKIE